MNLKDLFIECSISSGYQQTKGKVDWKESGDIMYFMADLLWFMGPTSSKYIQRLGVKG